MRFEHGRGGVLAGAGIGVAELCRLADCVKAFEVAVCPLEIIAGDGDFGIAHAVTDEQDDVLGGAVADGRNALCAAVLSQFRNGLAVQIVSGSFVGERRCRKRAERCNGSDCCNRSFESLSIAHLFLLSSACAVLQSPRQVSQTNFRGVLDEQNVNSRLHKVNTYLKSSFRQPSFPIPPKY